MPQYSHSRPMSQLDLMTGNNHFATNNGSRLSLGNGSRLSFAASDKLLMGSGGGHSRRQSAVDVEMSDLGGNFPTDDALLNEIRQILRTVDLMSVTKKGVKLELERRFGVNLDAKRAYINSGMFESQVP